MTDNSSTQYQNQYELVLFCRALPVVLRPSKITLKILHTTVYQVCYNIKRTKLVDTVWVAELVE